MFHAGTARFGQKCQVPEVERSVSRTPDSPKGPCRNIVCTWGPQGFPCNDGRAPVYTIELHGPFGAVHELGFDSVSLF